MSDSNLIPVQEFLIVDVTPEEFSKYLDQIYYECSMSALKNDAGVSDETIQGLFLIHKFSKTLKKCKT
jgi:hypothetical protein